VSAPVTAAAIVEAAEGASADLLRLAGLLREYAAGRDIPAGQLLAELPMPERAELVALLRDCGALPRPARGAGVARGGWWPPGSVGAESVQMSRRRMGMTP
jgi:hypothetical protein